MNKSISTKEIKANAILDAATAYLVVKPTASLQDIAVHAGIGIATLHRYFPSRELLMIQLALRATAVIQAKMDEIRMDENHLEEYLPALIEQLIPLGDKVFFLNYEASLEGYPEVMAAEEQLKQTVKSVIENLQKQRFLRSDLSSKWMVDTLYALLFATWENVEKGFIARKEAAHLLTETLFHGFSTGHPTQTKE